MHRFLFSDEPLTPATFVSLPQRLAHQIHTVLHLQKGEQIMLFNNSGQEFLCTIQDSNRDQVLAFVESSQRGDRDTELEIILCQALLRTSRFEWILEKGTELGVTQFAPMATQRSLSGLEEPGKQKLLRWQRIVKEATEQCGRSKAPSIQPVRPFSQVLQELGEQTAVLIPWEEEHTLHLRIALRRLAYEQPSIQRIALLIGPEGGFTPAEIAQAEAMGAISVSLGKRILRAETAAIAAVASIFYEMEAE